MGVIHLVYIADIGLLPLELGLGSVGARLLRIIDLSDLAGIVLLQLKVVFGLAHLVLILILTIVISDRA